MQRRRQPGQAGTDDNDVISGSRHGAHECTLRVVASQRSLQVARAASSTSRAPAGKGT